jgi:hypothetical protein
MRWNAKHQEDDQRILNIFLFFPRKIKGEWRWWERAYIKQVYYCGWMTKRWATLTEYVDYIVSGWDEGF